MQVISLTNEQWENLSVSLEWKMILFPLMHNNIVQGDFHPMNFLFMSIDCRDFSIPNFFDNIWFSRDENRRWIWIFSLLKAQRIVKHIKLFFRNFLASLLRSEAFNKRKAIHLCSNIKDSQYFSSKRIEEYFCSISILHCSLFIFHEIIFLKKSELLLPLNSREEK